jgi:hypothetical protein
MAEPFLPVLKLAGTRSLSAPLEPSSLTFGLPVTFDWKPQTVTPVPTPDATRVIERIWWSSETSSAAIIPQPIIISTGVEESKDWQSVVPRSRSIDERLFEALAEVKILTSKIAMHLDRDWRNKLFAQLDRMHVAAEWDEEDELLNASSFETFLQTWFVLKPKRNPGFGISVRGYLLASWVSEDSQLSLEFFPNGRVSWVVSIPADIPSADENLTTSPRERACGQTHLASLLSRLEPYDPQRWLANDKSKAAD